jgi:hypothetical protein
MFQLITPHRACKVLIILHPQNTKLLSDTDSISGTGILVLMCISLVFIKPQHHFTGLGATFIYFAEICLFLGLPAFHWAVHLFLTLNTPACLLNDCEHFQSPLLCLSPQQGHAVTEAWDRMVILVPLRSSSVPATWSCQCFWGALVSSCWSPAALHMHSTSPAFSQWYKTVSCTSWPIHLSRDCESNICFLHFLITLFLYDLVPLGSPRTGPLKLM